MARWVVGCCLIGLSSAYASASAPDNYAHQLLVEVSKSNPQLVGAAIIAAAPKTTAPVVVASTQAGQAGAPAAPADLAVITNGTAATASTNGGARVEVRLPLRDVSGDTVGALHLTYTSHSANEADTLAQAGARIRDRLARRISHAGNLFDPVPYEREAPAPNIRAQQLVDAFMEKYPEIEILVIHATPPDSDYNVIAGSSIGRLGKKADNDDMRCIFTGKPNLEINSTGKRFESEMQLHDRAGEVIGALGVVFAYKPGADKEGLHQRAERIKVELEKEIPDAASLFSAATVADERRKS